MSTETPKEPSAIEMRANLAQDAQANRYSKEVLIAIMRCIDGTADQYNDKPVFPVQFPV